ncbi:MAG TPA: hypothetical protein VI485_24275 [Vicinamibacterales bacterium]|nr:hypothetical protein [Vicinamibacterales bacterium]
MRPYRQTLTLVAVALFALAGAAGAQQPQSKPQPQPAGQQQPQPAAQQQAQPAPQPDLQPVARPRQQPLVPLEVQVVISRYQGEKRVSSVPYVLAVNANSTNAQLNMGAEVPVASSTFMPVADGKPSPAPIRSYNYRQIGTQIECGASSADDGRFELSISVDDSSVFTREEASSAGVGDMPVFRSFRSRNRVLLRDGQSRQYTAATDKVSGETVKIDVTLKVVK